MKRKLISIILIAVVMAEALALMILPASAASWSWKADGKCVVASYNAPIVKDGSIMVDARLDDGYLKGTKITSYPDAEPYLRNGYESIWNDVRGEFEAYVALDTKGLYIYAEIEDITIHSSTNSNGNDGDFMQIYLDWCTEDIVHPTSAEMYAMYNAGNAFRGDSYSTMYSVAGLQYIGYLSADYYGKISSSGGFAPHDQLGPDANDSVGYAATFIDGGWACEWFIPWRDDEQKAAVRHGEQFPLGIGIQVADDTDINNRYTGEKDIGLRYDQRKEMGLSYWSDYSRLADIVFVSEPQCSHSWQDGNVIKPATCTALGQKQMVCVLCGDTKTTAIPTLGHDTKNVICTVAKKRDVVCQRCGIITREGLTTAVLDGVAESHVLSGSSNSKSPTCTESGLLSVVCKYCDKASEETVVPPLGHSYRYSDTAKKYICQSCGELGHTGDANGDGAITNADVLEIYRNIYDDAKYPIGLFGLADANGDGDITNADVLEIYRNIFDADKYPLEEKEPTLVLDNTSIWDYTIVYPANNLNGERALAEKLAKHFADSFGAELAVSTSWNGEGKAIVVGDHTSCVDSSVRRKIGALTNYKVDMKSSMIASADSILWLAATNSHTLKAAVDKLVELTTPISAEDNIRLAFSAAETSVNVTVSSIGDELKVMSYNVQTGTPDSTRVTNMIKNITDFMPDVLGTQELNYKWIQHLKSKGVLDEYTLIGEPRNGNKDTDLSNGNEYSAILFRTSKFDLIDSGTFWLSDTPTVAGTKHSSSDYIRIMTYAVLERKSDGKRFLHVNTHLEWDHGTVKTNLIQIEIMQGLVNSKVYSKYGELPTFYTGDFNVTETSDGYAYMLSSGHSDSRYVAEKSTNENTFSGGSRIDFCFVSNGDFVVSEFDVGYGLSGSDHYPVYVRMYFN